MPVCKKCSDNFPNRIEINGVVKNISKRSNCLKCSPFDRIESCSDNCSDNPTTLQTPHRPQNKLDPCVIRSYKDDRIIIELYDNGMVIVETNKNIISLSPIVTNPIINIKPDPLKSLDAIGYKLPKKSIVKTQDKIKQIKIGYDSENDPPDFLLD